MTHFIRSTFGIVLAFMLLSFSAQAQTYYPNNNYVGAYPTQNNGYPVNNAYNNYNNYNRPLSLKERLLGRSNNQVNNYPQQYPQAYPQNYAQQPYQNYQPYPQTYPTNQVVYPNNYSGNVNPYPNYNNSRYINPNNYDPVYPRSSQYGGEVVHTFSAQDEIARIRGRR